MGRTTNHSPGSECRAELAAKYGDGVVEALEAVVSYCEEAAILVRRGRDAFEADVLLRRASEAIFTRIGDTIRSKLSSALLEDYLGQHIPSCTTTFSTTFSATTDAHPYVDERESVDRRTRSDEASLRLGAGHQELSTPSGCSDMVPTTTVASSSSDRTTRAINPVRTTASTVRCA